MVARGYEDGPYGGPYRAVARVPGGWEATRQLDVRLLPPRSAVLGTLCVRNLGDQPVDLVGSHDGRAFNRPSVTVNGEPTPTELQLRLLEPGWRSLLSRAGDVMEHASTLRPFGAWWWWLLGLAVVTLAPLGVWLAMRSALAADAAEGRLANAPIGGMAPRERAPPGGGDPRLGDLTALGAVAVLWFLYWGINTHAFQNGEDQYVYLSRWLNEGFPQSLWNFESYGRGLQRLEVWLLALPAAVFDAPWSLIGGRLLNTVAFVSTADTRVSARTRPRAAAAVGGAAGGAQRRSPVGSGDDRVPDGERRLPRLHVGRVGDLADGGGAVPGAGRGCARPADRRRTGAHRLTGARARAARCAARHGPATR